MSREDKEKGNKKWHTRRDFLIIGTAAAAAVGGAYLGKNLLFPPPIITTTVTSTVTTTQDPYERFLKERPEFGDFTETDYKLYLIYKENLPRYVEEPRLFEHTHDRIKCEVGFWDYSKGYDKSINSVLDQDIIEHAVIPNGQYDLKVEDEAKDMFGFDYGFSLYSDILAKDIPDRNNRMVVHENRAIPGSINTMDLSTLEIKPSMVDAKQTVVNNIQTIINGKLKDELMNSFNNPDSEEAKRIEKNFEVELNTYADALWFPHSGTFYRDKLDSIFAKDKRMSLHRHTIAYSRDKFMQKLIKVPEWRVGNSCTMAKIYGGSILPSYEYFSETYSDPRQAYVVHSDILEEIKKYGEIIELGPAVSLSAPELNAAKEDKMVMIDWGWSYADVPNRDRIFRI